MKHKHAGQRTNCEPPVGGAKQDSLPAIREPGQTWRDWLVALGVLAMLTLAMFGQALFGSNNMVLGHRGTDLFLQYVHSLTFGFGELRRGNLALWNPHVYCGAPFFGEFEPALLYPPNALFLFLPLAKAVNWSIALHVLLAGVFTYAWAAHRGLRSPACWLAAAMFMFSGINSLHIYAGHLRTMCAFAWAPLLFLAIDGMLARPSLGWSLLGMFAAAMQMLSGAPQYVFCTAVAAALYCALGLARTPQRMRPVFGLAGIVLGAVALAAVQLFTSFQEWQEMVRGAGTDYAFAAKFSFPPENFLTFLAPYCFGDMKTVTYWGRAFLWEMCVFVSITGLAMAVAGVVWGGRSARRSLLVMVALLFVLALGAHTPLFKLLHHWVPGFDKFRGSSKFIFPAFAFLALLAGIGLNELLKGRRPPRWLVVSVVGVGCALLVAAAWVHNSSSNDLHGTAWRRLMLALRSSQESLLPPDLYEDPAFLRQAGAMAVRALLIGGGTLFTLAGLLMWLRKSRLAVWALLVLAVAELVVFGRKSLDYFDATRTVNPQVKQCLEANPGDYRVLNVNTPDAGMSLGTLDISGGEPGIMLRYAQLLGLTQGVDPDQATDEIPFLQDYPTFHPLFDMFRCRFLFVWHDNREMIYESTNYLPHLLLVQRCRVFTERNQILSALTNAAFNPREEVILETMPEPQPVAAAEPGTVRLVDSSTDHLTIEADARSPSLLLITDSYAKAWQARALPGSSQPHYQVMPANYCLRAVPLGPGHHHFRLEYLPKGFLVGQWVSLIALALFLGLVAWRIPFWRRQATRPNTAQTGRPGSGPPTS
jgi:hypothetical protein